MANGARPLLASRGLPAALPRRLARAVRRPARRVPIAIPVIETVADATSQAPRDDVGGTYARYVLGVLVVVYVFNFIDRQILSILAEEIKADLNISDGDIGFLFGTAFAVFYAIFGIPLGRLADLWVRKSLISVGLFFWSGMTALSGTAQSFGQLAMYRFGVGIGEASATPAAFSMLSDYFAPRVRATVIALYSSGVYIGAGIGVFLGGLIVDSWKGWYPDPALAPLGLKAWQAAFLAVGVPGLGVSLWVSTLREPQRGMSEGMTTPRHPHPFREALREFLAVLPGLTLLGIFLAGGRARELTINLTAAAAVIALAVGLTALTHSAAQWAALGVGVYAAISWVQVLQLRDPAVHAMVFGSKALLACCVAFPSVAFVTYGIGFWSSPFFIRVHHVSTTEVGTYLGLSSAVGGFIGVSLGGYLGDRLRRVTPLARMWVGMAAPVLCAPPLLVMLHTQNIVLAYAANFVFSILSPMWIGPAASTVNDLVMPRMRALASAFYLLMVTFIGLALGPYLMGVASDAFTRQGMAAGDALRLAMELGLSMLLLTVAMIIVAMRHLPAEERSRLDRARAVGESIGESIGEPIGEMAGKPGGEVAGQPG